MTTRHNGRRLFIGAAAAASVLVVDQLSKAMVTGASGGLTTGAVLPIRNGGLVTGIAAGGRAAVVALAAAMLAGFGAIVARRVRAGRLAPWAAGLLLGGAVSNLVDRLALGSVRDFLIVSGWVINLADVAIVVGIVAYGWGSLVPPHTAPAVPR